MLLLVLGLVGVFLNSPSHAQMPVVSYVPPSLAENAEPRPLVVMLHGCTQDPTVFAQLTRMNEWADREGFYVLYPQQTEARNERRCWNWFNRQTETEALGIISAVQDMVRDYPVDRERIYVAGLSAGGAMASYLAYCHHDVFQAGASHSGVSFRRAGNLVEGLLLMHSGRDAILRPTRTCTDGRAARMLILQGKEDGLVELTNAFVLQSDIADPATSRVVTLPGLDHDWSGGTGDIRKRNALDASEEIVEFFGL